jgi:hypothetical protein
MAAGILGEEWRGRENQQRRHCAGMQAFHDL